MNPLSNEGDAFRLLLIVIVAAAGVAAAGVLGDGWTALAVVLSLAAGTVLGSWLARQRPETEESADPAQMPGAVVGLPVLVVAPAELAGPALAREVADEGAGSARVVLFAAEQEHGEAASRAAAELRALLEELGVAAQVISARLDDAVEAVRAELRDGISSHVFVATHRREHPAFEAEERLVHAIDGASETPVVAVAFAAP
jgi:hypothetical protein